MELERVKQTGEVAEFTGELRRLVNKYRTLPSEQILAALGHAAGYTVLTQLDRLTAADTANLLLMNVSEVLDRCVPPPPSSH